MLFNSLSYAIFLPLVCLAYYAVPQKARWAVLLLFSYYFYMSWNPTLVVLILFTTVVSFAAALCIERLRKRPKAQKWVLIAGAGLCLATLIFFKYFNFLAQNANALVRALGGAFSVPTFSLILPVGISFYTFQTLSYIVDVKRGRLPAERHFGYYALYVSFFPQLVAGPIERADRLLPQFRAEHRFSSAKFSEGLRKILVGLLKKVVIADYIAGFVNAVYNDLPGKTGLTLLGATALFAVQIYCDFSGYSDIAVGSAALLGFDLMENFQSPYFARSIREFWHCWHISLTTWFTDYVYIPLGGSRCSRARHWRNLLLTFCLSGLWHGANWTFLCWGLYHGLWLCAETLYVKRLDALQSRLGPWCAALLNAVRTAFTLLIAVLGWVFFRANSLEDALYVYKNLWRGLNPLRLAEYMAPAGMGVPQLWCAAAMLALLALYDGLSHYVEPATRLVCRARPAVRYALYWAAAAGILLTLMLRPFGAAADFIYFQF